MWYPPERVKIVIPVKHIPDGAEIQKRTGTKRYRIRRTVQVAESKLTAEYGTAFLVPVDGGDIYAIAEDTEVVWELYADTLISMLEPDK